MKNIEVRVMVSESGVKFKDIARKLNITPQWLSAIMREELSEFNKARILHAVHDLKGENNDRICESKEGNLR